MMAQNLFQQLGKERTVLGESWENFSGDFYDKKQSILHHTISHTIHVWYIYVHLVDFYG